MLVNEFIEAFLVFKWKEMLNIEWEWGIMCILGQDKVT